MYGVRSQERRDLGEEGSSWEDEDTLFFMGIGNIWWYSFLYYSSVKSLF